MTGIVGTAGGNKAIGSIHVGTAGGNKAVQVAYVGTAGGNKVWFSSFSASIIPSDASGFSSSSIVSSNTVAATPSGGVGPFTYLWSVDDPFISLTASPSLAAMGFQALLAPEEIISGIATCLVTDTATGITSSPTVPVFLARI